MKYVWVVLLLLSSTCHAEFSKETWREELSWQALNLLDTATTATYRSRYPNCAKEAGSWQVFIGQHPSTGKALLGGAIAAGSHYAITVALENHDAPRWIRRVWQAVTITSSGIMVTNNVRILTTKADEYAACEVLWSNLR